MENKIQIIVAAIILVTLAGIGIPLIVGGNGTAVSLIVKDPGAEPYVIPEDTDGVPSWGESATLSVNVTNVTSMPEIGNITIDLAAIGGRSITYMSLVGNYTESSTLWCMFNHTTNASVGTANWNGTAYVPHSLQVNATDARDPANSTFNNSVSIDLLVMKNGDVQPYEGDGEVDFTHDALYLVRYTKNVPGYEGIRDTIADVTGDGEVDFTHDALYLVRHTKNVPGYEVLH